MTNVAKLCHGTVARACEDGCTACLTKVLEKGQPADGRNNLGWTPLHVVAHKNYLECLRILLARPNPGIDSTSFEGQTPLMLSVVQGHYEICETLLRAGASASIKDSYEQPPLISAINNDRNDLVKLLCAYGADTNALDYSPDYLLNHAADRKETTDANIVKTLLENGANVMNTTCYGFNALMSALSANNIKAFDVILDFMKSSCTRDDIFTVVNQLSEGTLFPVTALSLAAQLRDPRPLATLLECGADPNAFDCVAIFWSAMGHIECMKQLLPPVTDLAALECARHPRSELFRKKKCILMAAAESDSEVERADGSSPGDRLRFLLESGLHSIINLTSARTSISPRMPPVVNWRHAALEPIPIEKVLSQYTTTLTRMVEQCVHEKNIQVMVKHGATWKKRHALSVGSPFLFTDDPKIIRILCQNQDMDYYHPHYAFNLTVLAQFMSHEALDHLLKSGAECQSCFDPLTDNVRRDAWTFERILRWLKENKDRNIFSNSVHPINFPDIFTDKNLHESFIVLLKHTCSRGSRLWILDLIDDQDLRTSLATIISQQFSLKQQCRIFIRDELRETRRDSNKLMTIVKAFGLPLELEEYLMMV